MDDEHVKVFISSVRRGLEEERGSLRGLIAAVGHTPLAFEDFTTQPVPPRQACLDGVAAADAYLLLVGPNYGHRFDDTNQSPTHDEWVAATAGIPRLVFLKEGVDLDDDQQEIYRSVSSYRRASSTTPSPRHRSCKPRSSKPYEPSKTCPEGSPGHP